MSGGPEALIEPVDLLSRSAAADGAVISEKLTVRQPSTANATLGSSQASERR